jgi:ribA/ribD-fused uncharacterized protein
MITIPYYETSFIALHNFSANAIVIDGITYPTAEHAFHALKFDDHRIREEIINSASPVAAFHLGKKYKPYRRADWDDIKVGVLEDIIRRKAQQNPDVKEALLLSGDEQIVEMNEHDDFWGSGADGNGMNHTGKILMKIRDELKSFHS